MALSGSVPICTTGSYIGGNGLLGDGICFPLPSLKRPEWKNVAGFHPYSDSGYSGIDPKKGHAEESDDIILCFSGCVANTVFELFSLSTRSAARPVSWALQQKHKTLDLFQIPYLQHIPSHREILETTRLLLTAGDFVPLHKCALRAMLRQHRFKIQSTP